MYAYRLTGFTYNTTHIAITSPLHKAQYQHIAPFNAMLDKDLSF
jgi:hypothetical protein